MPGHSVESVRVDIKEIVQPMRGKSRSLLVIGSDERYYVMKCAGDQMKNRRLANECLGHVMLEALGVKTPDVAWLHVQDSQRLTGAFPAASFGCLSKGLHFGSQLPADPKYSSIYDSLVLPRTLLPRIANVHEFATTFVADLWLSNGSVRQAVLTSKTEEDGSKVLVAHWIDNDELMSGANWNIDENFVQMRRRANLPIPTPTMQALCSAAVDTVISLNVDTLKGRVLALAAPWLARQETCRLARLIDELSEKRLRLQGIVAEALDLCGFINPKIATKHCVMG
jgi:hypothetical protein